MVHTLRGVASTDWFPGPVSQGAARGGQGLEGWGRDAAQGRANLHTVWDALGASHSRPPSCVALFPPNGRRGVCCLHSLDTWAQSSVSAKELSGVSGMHDRNPTPVPSDRVPEVPWGHRVDLFRAALLECAHQPPGSASAGPSGPEVCTAVRCSGGHFLFNSPSQRGQVARHPPPRLPRRSGMCERGIFSGGGGAAGRGGSEETGLSRSKPSCDPAANTEQPGVLRLSALGDKAFHLSVHRGSAPCSPRPLLSHR